MGAFKVLPTTLTLEYRRLRVNGWSNIRARAAADVAALASRVIEDHPDPRPVTDLATYRAVRIAMGNQT